MSFDPINGSKKIHDDYVSYLKTTFFINDPDYMREFEEKISVSDALSRGPFIDVTDSFKTGDSLEELVLEGVASGEFRKLCSESLPINRPLYKHQEDSFKKIVADKNAIVTTGTGSGKTESFLLPVIDYLMKEKENGMLTDGVRALIIYPMNALANDQMKRLRSLLKNYPYITFGTYTGETEKSEDKALEKYRRQFRSYPLKNERISRDRIKESPPHILITNYAMLEYLLLRPGDNVIFSGSFGNCWKYIILDEAHTYSGATGIEVSMLLRRLKSRLQTKNKIRFILTSATLGSGEKDDPEIIHFAKTLCSDDDFDKNSIIRADRISPIHPEKVFRLSSECYHGLAEILESGADADEVYDFIKLYVPGIVYNEKTSVMIFDLVSSDNLYYAIKKELANNTKTIDEIAEKLAVSKQEIVDFISVASKGRKNGCELFDGRYHYFLRALAGAYISLKPFKELFLEPYYQNDGHPVYSFSVCRSCGQIYISGLIDNDLERDIQYLRSKMNEKEKPDTFILTDKFVKDEEYKTYKICSKCAAVSPANSIKGKFCSCGSKYEAYITETDDTKTVLNRCICCDYTNNSNGILRNFYVGQDAATSVAATSLYNVIPSSTKRIRKIKSVIQDDYGFGFDSENEEKTESVIESRTKQYLIFSDSRQQAAYFSSYFDSTYHNILRRRILFDVLKRNVDRYKGGISVKTLVHDIHAAFEKYKIFAQEEREKEAVKTVLYEMLNKDRNSPEQMGIIRFAYEYSGKDLSVFPQGKTKSVINVLADNFRHNYSVYYDDLYSLTSYDKEFFQYGSADKCFVLNAIDKNNYNSCWKENKHMNSRTSYLKRLSASLGEEWGTEKTNSFLDLVWERIFKPSLQTDDNTGFRMQISAFKVFSIYSDPVDIFRCEQCGRVTSDNVGNVCPTYRCTGRLVKFDINSLNDDHYFKLYNNLDIYDLRIKEHTAQLSVEKAKEYQEEFINKDINILSCSTTFEMGVDVGDLETVMLKNMPPTPANYIQRVGRAGRRTDSTAFALTFCRTSSHDTNFFNRPTDMICGQIQPPFFKTVNEKIVRRHAYAVCLSEFFRAYPESFSDADTLMITDKYDLLRNYIRVSRDRLCELIKKSVPSELYCRIDQWLERLLSEEGELSIAHDTLKNEIELLEEELNTEKNNSSMKASSYDKLKRISGAINTLKKEPIISFLSRYNLIPKYGFPVDCVELRVRGDLIKKSSLRLERDMKIAVGEYAPGSQIIADGMIYTSRYISKPPSKEREWKIYAYGKCTNPLCENVNVRIHTFNEEVSIGQCSFCGEEVQKIGEFIVPESGFIAENHAEKAYTKKPAKNYVGYINYIGKIQEEENRIRKTHFLSDKKIELISSFDDELLVLSRSSFYVCPICGYAEKAKEQSTISRRKTVQHKRPGGYACRPNSMQLYSLGHTFRTDVVRIDFYETTDHVGELSVLYTLLEGISRTLKIERSDIDGCVQKIKTQDGYAESFIIFDNVPGGAGHVSRIMKLENDEFRKLLLSSYEVVNKCTCGGDSGDSACYGCLWNYSNQNFHNILSRKAAKQYLEKYLCDNQL